jgi:hypothetical protein
MFVCSLAHFVGASGYEDDWNWTVHFPQSMAWYAARAAWDLSPGYELSKQLFLTRPVELACLQCHASGLQPIKGTRNGYGSPVPRKNSV